VLCYAAGRRQITDALTMGVDESTESVVVALLDRPADGDGTSPEDGTSLEEAANRLQDRFELADPAADADARDVLESVEESRLCSFFDVSAAEREAALAEVPELVAERVTLLVVER
jgi:KEOPS complex subunit Cgi121